MSTVAAEQLRGLALGPAYGTMFGHERPALLWVASYEHGARRWRASGCDHPCLLQPQPWLQERLEAVNAPDLAPAVSFVRRTRRPIALQGLVAVVPGSVRDTLSERSLETEALWLYFKKRADAFSVKAVSRFRCSDDTPEHHLFFRRSAKPGARPNSVALQTEHGMVFDAADLDGAVVVDEHGARRDARSVMREYGVPDGQPVPTLVLVEPIARLLFAGRWQCLLCLARWKPSMTLWPEWPSREWALEASGKSCPGAEGGLDLRDLSSTLQGLASRLRQWAPRILQAGSEVGHWLG